MEEKGAVREGGLYGSERETRQREVAQHSHKEEQNKQSKVVGKLDLYRKQ